MRGGSVTPAVPPEGTARGTIRLVPPTGPEADGHWSAVRLGLVADLLARVAAHRAVRVRCELEDGPPPDWLATALLDVRALGGRVPVAAVHGAPAGACRLAVDGTDVGGEPAFVVPRRRLDGAGWSRSAPRCSAARRCLDARCDVTATPLHEPGWHTAGSLAGAEARAAPWLAALGPWADAPREPADEAVVADVEGLPVDPATWPAALDRLDRLVDAASRPAGARYECVAWADRVLGLGHETPASQLTAS